MTPDATFAGKRVSVIGAARTGVAVARALVPRGACVTVLEGKPESAMPEAAAALRAAGAKTVWERDNGREVAGADIVVPSPGVPRYAPVLVEAAERGQTIWSEPEVAWRISEAPIIGITGTNGKTTTTALIGAMLKDAGRDARVGGNIAPGRPLIEIASDAPKTAVLVAELSSFQLEWVDGFRPLVGVITNITEDHLNRHKSMEEYAGAKARLFENQGKGDHAVVNADNPPALEAGRASGGMLWTWSRRREVERGASVRDGSIFIRDGNTEKAIIPVDAIRIRGAHNLENAMAAAVTARILGLDADNIGYTLQRFPGVEHRMEAVATVGSVEYINNSMCTNPAALAASIRACDRPLVLIAGGAGKGLDFAEVPAAMAKHCRAVVTIGDMGPALAEMAREARVPAVQYAGDLAAAVDASCRAAQPGDIVMLAPGCASFDQFTDFEDRGNQFKALVERLGAAAA